MNSILEIEKNDHPIKMNFGKGFLGDYTIWMIDKEIFKSKMYYDIDKEEAKLIIDHLQKYFEL